MTPTPHKQILDVINSDRCSLTADEFYTQARDVFTKMSQEEYDAWWETGWHVYNTRNLSLSLQIVFVGESVTPNDVQSMVMGTTPDSCPAITNTIKSFVKDQMVYVPDMKCYWMRMHEQDDFDVERAMFENVVWTLLDSVKRFVKTASQSIRVKEWWVDGKEFPTELNEEDGRNILYRNVLCDYKPDLLYLHIIDHLLPALGIILPYHKRKSPAELRYIRMEKKVEELTSQLQIVTDQLGAVLGGMELMQNFIAAKSES